jgi:hypothetical protein
MTTRCYNIPINQEVSTRYTSDLTNQEFALIAPHVAEKEGSGKKRTVHIKEVLNAIFYRTSGSLVTGIAFSDRWVYLGS